MCIGPAMVFRLVGAVVLLTVQGEAKPGARYGVEPDLTTYPQDSAKATLDSVIKSADAGKFDYLVAQLADPSFMDARVKSRFDGRFAEQVQDTRARLDPPALKELLPFLNDGEGTINKSEASMRLKDVSDHVAFFRDIDGRWFLEHPSKPKI